MIEVAKDFEGLKQAARELMEEARLAGDRLPGPEESELRTMADGYYTRVAYLLSLERLKEFGIELRLIDLDAAELHGLLALRVARGEFEREHPPCPQCGVPLETPFAAWCSPCGWRRATGTVHHMVHGNR